MGQTNLDRKEAYTHFRDEEVKNQISSCLTHEATELVNYEAETSPLAFLAPELRCFPQHPAGAQEKQTLECSDNNDFPRRVSSPFLSPLFLGGVCVCDQYGCSCNCRGGVCFRRKEGQRERRLCLFSPAAQRTLHSLFQAFTLCPPPLGLCLSLDFHPHPISPMQAEFLNETIEMWDPRIFRNKAWS